MKRLRVRNCSCPNRLSWGWFQVAVSTNLLLKLMKFDKSWFSGKTLESLSLGNINHQMNPSDKLKKDKFVNFLIDVSANKSYFEYFEFCRFKSMRFVENLKDKYIKNCWTQRVIENRDCLTCWLILFNKMSFVYLTKAFCMKYFTENSRIFVSQNVQCRKKNVKLLSSLSNAAGIYHI